MMRWSTEKANTWWNKQKWAIGANYVTSDAVNDVEMWMDATFNPELIRRELKCANGIGFNSVRVFLSYTVWKNEKEVFERNFDTFLSISAECGISVMPVLFDDCAFDGGADPVYGRQPDPIPGVSNGRWVPSPGFAVQDDPVMLEGCRDYVSAVIGKHRTDNRIIAWDLYNEPGNTNRVNKCFPMLKAAFDWARKEEPLQPITAALWLYNQTYDEINSYLLDNSDIISLHSYSDINTVKALYEKFAQYDRPIIITEWLCRAAGSNYATHLPFFCEKKIGCWQWGIIVGKTQTNLPWSTWQKPDPNPAVWQHDILYPDLTPYSEEEISILKSFAFGAKDPE